MRKYLLLIIFTLVTFVFCTQKKQRKIAIQPLGKYNVAYVDTIKLAIENYYGFTTYVLPKKEIPKPFFVNIKSPRYRADSIIRYLRKTKNDSITNVIGYTSFDISTTKKDEWGKVKEPIFKYQDWGVFGLGYRPGPSAVLSDFRIKGTNKTIERLKKVTLHELGHNLGLPHCENKHCFMRDAAESIRTVDEVELNLCSKCKAKI